MSQSVKIAPVSIKGNPKKSSVVDIFIAEPLANKEFLAGKLFVLSEVTKNKKNAEKINSFLIEKINYFYYESDKILLREKLSSLKPEHIFETALSKTNQAFQSFLKSEKISNHLDGLSITVGLVYQNEIHFSLFGDNKIFIVYKHVPQNNEQGEYKIIDLSKQSEKSDNNIFSNILSGAIPAQGGIFVCNETMSEYLSAKQITQIISALPPVGAAEQIKNLLEKINYFISFGGIIIKEGRSSVSEKKAVAQTTIDTSDSVYKLNVTENTTEKILSPSGIFSLKNIFSKILQNIAKKSSSKNTMVLKDRIYTQKRLFGFSKGYVQQLTTILSYPINTIYYLIKKISKLNIGRFFNGNTAIIVKQSISSLIAKNKNWSNKKIILAAAFSFIAVILIFNIFTSKKEQTEIIQTENYDNLVSEIEKMQNQVDANLLYSNEEGAQKLFDQINEMITSLPQENESQIEKYNEFKSTFETQLNNVRRITIIDNPLVLADFKNINSGATCDSLILLDNYLYVTDSSQKSFYITDIDDNTVTTLTELNTNVNNPISPTINNSSIYYFNQDSVIELNSEDKKLTKVSFPTNIQETDVTAIGTYNSRLYVVVKNDNQILRFNRQGDEFGSAYNWITEKTDLSKTVDMFIDGNVYLLNNDGGITKFLRGQAQEFSLEKIEPALLSPTKISGSQEADYLFILEPTNNRLVVYDKKGQFIAQYKSDKFDDLKDFSVDEENKNIYILNGNTLYGFGAAFLQ